MEINLQKLNGRWNDGYALDVHTLSARPLEKDDNGNVTKWDKTYTPIGEQMNKLKYWGEIERVKIIGETAADAIKSYLTKWQIDLIIPIPPSKLDRPFQPVIEIAKVFAKSVNLPIDYNGLKKTKATPQMIGITDIDERRNLLQGVFDVQQNAFSGKDILLLDDLFRSGETLNAATNVLMKKGNARGVYVLTITKTRVHR
jgi:competence protein ComFC